MSEPVSFLVAFGAVFGASEAIKHIQSDARKKEHRSRKNNFIVRCLKSSQYSPLLEGRRVVLSGDKLYIDTGTDYQTLFGHPVAGFFLPFPETKHSGLVTTICDEPPMMNWIYVDADTYELKFGTRAWAEYNLPIPFDCTRQDRRLTFAGWEGFFAVKEGNFWALYFDIDRDNLKSKVKEDVPVLEVVLVRAEIRVPPPPRGEPGEGESKDAVAEKGTSEPSEGQGAAGDGQGAAGDAQDGPGLPLENDLVSPEVD